MDYPNNGRRFIGLGPSFGQPPEPRPTIAADLAKLLDLLYSEEMTGERFAMLSESLLRGLVDSGDKDGARRVHQAALELIRREADLPKPGAVDKAETDGLILYPPERYEEGSYTPSSSIRPLLERLVTDMQHATHYRDRGIEIPNRAFFTGQPGTGKTACAQYLAHQLGKTLVVVPLDAMKSRFVGQTQRNLAAACKVAQDANNAVIFFDEADTLFPRRDKVSMSDEGQNTTGAFLQRSSILAKDAPDLLIVLASNLEGLVDPALRQRMTTHIVFENPDVETRRQILANLWRKLPAEDEARDWLIERTADRSGRYLHLLAHDAGRAAINASPEEPRVTLAHVRAALLAAPAQEELGRPKLSLR